MTNDAIKELVLAVARNERTQQRIRTAVTIKLAKIETILTMIHGAQIATTHDARPGFDEKVRDHAKAVEDYIEKHSKELGLMMIEYVCAAPERQKARTKRGKRFAETP